MDTTFKSKSFCLALAVAVLLLPGCKEGDGRAVTAPAIALTLLAGGFDEPTHVTHAGDGSGRLFVVERPGRIRVIKNGLLLPAPFLDIGAKVQTTGQEQGLLSVAFPPGFAVKQYFYVNYSSVVGNGDTVVARYRVTANPDVADPLSEQILLTEDQPFANHNGGQLAFGPDGFLYIGMGDGGSGGDPFGNGQKPGTLHGKLLRIDTETSPAVGYRVPASNPFINQAGFRPEIWALGLRNPWRFSFDRLTGDLYIGDVGQNRVEEIDFQPAVSPGGQNYGWNIMEGSECFNAAAFTQPLPQCNQTDLTLPVAEYSHAAGNCSVTAGSVYRAAEFPDLQGLFFYGDFCTGIIKGLRKNGGQFTSTDLLDSGLSISTFGEDEAGNLYVADLIGGSVSKIVRQPASSGIIPPN